MILQRIPGQTPLLPGGVRVGDLIYTSGIVDPAVIEGREPDVIEQSAAALAALIGVVESLGGSAESIVKIDAYISASEHIGDWNSAYHDLWPTPGPARTTLVAGFALSTIAVEVQAVAAVIA